MLSLERLSWSHCYDYDTYVFHGGLLSLSEYYERCARWDEEHEQWAEEAWKNEHSSD
jgi:hypothetical protein